MAEAAANDENVCPLTKAMESMNISQPAADDAKLSSRTVENVHELQVTLMNLVRQATNNQPANAPTTPDRVLLKGIIEAGEGNYETAIESFKQALELCSQVPEPELSESGVPLRPYLSDVGRKEVQLNCLNQIGICLCQLDKSEQSSEYFKKAMEGYMGDKELIAHVYDRYTRLMMNHNAAPNADEANGIEKNETPGEENSLPSPGEAVNPTGTPPDEVLSAEPEEKLRQDHAMPDLYALDLFKAPPTATGENFTDMPEEETWYPVAQDELLEYSCTYLEMMIFGAQLMFQQNPFVQPSPSSAPPPPAENPDTPAAEEEVE